MAQALELGLDTFGDVTRGAATANLPPSARVHDVHIRPVRRALVSNTATRQKARPALIPIMLINMNTSFQCGYSVGRQPMKLPSHISAAWRYGAAQPSSRSRTAP
jgi:hypothetical protein